jgi:hypothetical protein
MPVAAPPVAVATLHRSTPYASADLPDFLDGAARQRRARMFIVGVFVLAVAGAVIAAVSSHF